VGKADCNQSNHCHSLPINDNHSQSMSKQQKWSLFSYLSIRGKLNHYNRYLRISYKPNNERVCTVCKRNWTFSDQIIALTEKLIDLKYELPIVCIERDIQFLNYALFSTKMKIYTPGKQKLQFVFRGYRYHENVFKKK
jgi:hypothetical protein